MVERFLRDIEENKLTWGEALSGRGSSFTISVCGRDEGAEK